MKSIKKKKKKQYARESVDELIMSTIGSWPTLVLFSSITKIGTYMICLVRYRYTYSEFVMTLSTLVRLN